MNFLKGKRTVIIAFIIAFEPEIMDIIHAIFDIAHWDSNWETIVAKILGGAVLLLRYFTDTKIFKRE